MLEDVINKINNYIKNLENKEIIKKYNFFKLLISSNNINYNFDSENDIFSIIFSFILSSEKYKSLDEIIRVYNKYKDSFSKLNMYELNLFYVYLVCRELEVESYDLLREDEKDYTELFEVFDQSLKLVPDEVIVLIYHIKLFDYNKIYFNESIYDDMISNEIVTKSEQKSAKIFYKKNYIKRFKSHLNNFGFQQMLNNNIMYMDNLECEVKKINKNINKAKLLLEILKRMDLKEEIDDLDYILKSTPDELKYDVLKYIGLHNLKYYKDLVKEYNSKLEHSVSRYISLLYKYNINYEELDETLKLKILDLSFDELKTKLDNIEKVSTLNNAYAVVYSNTNIINYFVDCISLGIISKDFISNNIEVLFDPLNNSNSLFDLFKTNKDIISSNLNIRDIDNESFDIFLCDTNLIIDNLDVLIKYDIKINRSIKNYMFLGSNDLELKIIELINLDIDINKNLYLLNSDYNVINRIKICKLLNINIYDSSGRIKDEILFKDKFMMSNDMIEIYLNEKEKYKQLLYKI